MKVTKTSFVPTYLGQQVYGIDTGSEFKIIVVKHTSTPEIGIRHWYMVMDPVLVVGPQRREGRYVVML